MPLFELSGEPVLLSEFNKNFSDQDFKSGQDSAINRQLRLAAASGKPIRRAVVSYEYIRNPDVVAEVLVRATSQRSS